MITIYRSYQSVHISLVIIAL